MLASFLLGSVVQPAGGGGMPGAGTLLDVLGQWGVMGAALAALAWFAWSAVQRERARADQAEAREQKLNEAMRTEVIPVLTRATEAIVRVSEVMPDTVEFKVVVADLRSLLRDRRL